MMESLPADSFPAVARIAAVTGWLAGALVMAWDWRSPTKRALALVFAVPGLRYLSLMVGLDWLPTMQLLPALLVYLATVLDRTLPRWLLLVAAPLGFHPVAWTLSMAVVVSWLYHWTRALGGAIFLSAGTTLGLLLCELLPGFREWVTVPEIYRTMAYAVVTTQLYMPGWAVVRGWRRGEGHWLSC